jgi:transcription antitermination factor NusG
MSANLELIPDAESPDPVLTMLDEVPRWAVLRTSARWEKRLAEVLTAVGVPAYLPLMSKVTTYRSKRRTAESLLFSGYVFCSETDFLGNPRVPPAVRKKVAQVLRAPDPEELRRELRDIAELLCNRQLVQECVFGRPGTVVRVVGGPLRGVEGVISRLKPEKRVIVLEITFLGVRQEVELEEHHIAKS